MSYIIYMNEYPLQFQRAHSHVWDSVGKRGLEIVEQVNGWKNVHNAKIFGGCYNKDEFGRYKEINTSAIGLEFEDEVAFYIFMMAWS